MILVKELILKDIDDFVWLFCGLALTIITWDKNLFSIIIKNNKRNGKKNKKEHVFTRGSLRGNPYGYDGKDGFLFRLVKGSLFFNRSYKEEQWG